MRRLDPDTRRYYTNCLQDLLAFTRQQGGVDAAVLAAWHAHLGLTY